ncbi:hypothetical protein Ancab_004636 [Ancistrocladus abbreviatus]
MWKQIVQRPQKSPLSDYLGIACETAAHCVIALPQATTPRALIINASHILPPSTLVLRLIVKTSYSEVISESRTAHINGKLFTLRILEENFGGNWKPSALLTYNMPVVIQSSKEKESMSPANPKLKVSSSSSQASISGEAEADNNKDCNDDGNTKV